MSTIFQETEVREPLTRDEVASVIEGRSTARRIPALIHIWVHPRSFEEGRREEVMRILDRYPQDFQMTSVRMPNFRSLAEEAMRECGLASEEIGGDRQRALDERGPLRDLKALDPFLDRVPPASGCDLFSGAPSTDGRYRLGHWWFCFFERHWSLRGMARAMTDFYDHPEAVHRLYRRMTDFYLTAMERGREEQGLDGILTSDDLGGQAQTLFSHRTFRQFLLPYYTELFARAQALGMHFWLHSCGNVETFIPDWIDAGLSVLHPVQKRCMDEKRVGARFGGRIAFWAGVDVQRIVPLGTPGEVRHEVRHLSRTFWRPGEGRLILGAGNGINEDCPLENLEALLDEATRRPARNSH